jgi:hypothetical protein
LPIGAFSAISPAFIARLIKGCRGDGFVRVLLFEENLSTFNALTSIFAVWGRFRGRLAVAV